MQKNSRDQTAPVILIKDIMMTSSGFQYYVELMKTNRVLKYEVSVNPLKTLFGQNEQVRQIQQYYESVFYK